MSIIKKIQAILTFWRKAIKFKISYFSIQESAVFCVLSSFLFLYFVMSLLLNEVSTKTRYYNFIILVGNRSQVIIISCQFTNISSPGLPYEVTPLKSQFRYNVKSTTLYLVLDQASSIDPMSAQRHRRSYKINLSSLKKRLVDIPPVAGRLSRRQPTVILVIRIVI